MNNLDFCILKAITNNKKLALDFLNDGDPKLFSTETWNFANLIVGYIRTYKDIPTLRIITEKLSKNKNEKQVENVKRLWEEIQQISYDEKEYKHDLEKLKKRFAEKEILAIKEKFSKFESGSTDINAALNEMGKTIKSVNDLNKIKAYENKSVKEYLPHFVEKFKMKKENPNFDAGLKTKYAFLDYATNGLKPADFLIIAGESGFGKSLFLNNIALQTWLQDNDPAKTDNFSEGKNIIYFSLEMPYEDCFNRCLSRLARVPFRHIESPQYLTKEEFLKIKNVLEFINKYPYQFKIIDISEVCANDLETILIENNEDFDAIFVDYLGIMRPNQNGDEQDWLRQGVISYELRAIARKYKKPIFSAVQLNRKAGNKDSSENIGLSRLARSATIATHATHVLQIESKQGDEMSVEFVYHIIKNRKGPKGKGILLKDLPCVSLFNREDDLPSTEYDDMFVNPDDISEEIKKLNI